MINIVINSVIEWILEDKEHELERVLWLDPNKDCVVLINLQKKNALPVIKDLSMVNEAIINGSAIKRIVDPTARKYPKEELIPEKYREIRDRSYEIIHSIVVDEPDVFDPKLRGTAIREACEKFSVQKKDVYRYLSRYWQQGKNSNALLPNYEACGSEERGITEGVKRGRQSIVAMADPEKTGVNITEEIKAIFRVGVQLYYNNKEKNPLRRCFTLIKENHFNIGYRQDGDVQIPILPPVHEMPTFGQFKYWYSKELDLKKKLIAREGSRGFALRHRAVLGSSTQMAFGPGSIYQIDATIGDVYLVNSIDRTKIIGRPVIYIVIDVFSRYITGLYVGLEGPSWLAAKMALSNAFTDKVAFCKEFDIDIEEEEWYCPFLPESILADRGELIGFNSDNIIELLNTKVSNTSPFRADWKAIVEQNFRLLNVKSIHWLPGAIKERFRERGERDHRLDATLDLHQFTKIMIRNVLYHNNYHRMAWYSRDQFMISDHVEPIPSELWKWGLENRIGHLREKPADIVMLNLMPQDEATVTPFGIKFKGMHYSCDPAIKEQWFEKARAFGTWKVPIAYDFRNKADTINLILDNGKRYETCELLDKDSRNKSFRMEEVIDLQEYEKLAAAEYETIKDYGEAELNAHVQAIVAEGNDRTKASLENGAKSDTARTRDIRKNRKEERERLREEQQWDLRAKEPEPQPVSTAEEPLQPKLSKQDKWLAMLKQQKKGS